MDLCELEGQVCSDFEQPHLLSYSHSQLLQRQKFWNQSSKLKLTKLVCNTLISGTSATQDIKRLEFNLSEGYIME